MRYSVREKGLSLQDALALSRFAELAVTSRIGTCKFSFVFHVEGLMNPRISRQMKLLGKELHGWIRPCVTLITPLCPQYVIDPLVDRRRIDFANRPLEDSAERQFADDLSELSESFDIGYHGHFFTNESGRFRPSFQQTDVEIQFRQEVNYLTRLGFRPKYYSGGWWYISRHLGRLLVSAGFEADTTVNDTGLDSFGRRQEISRRELGTPFLLEAGVVEIPAVRAWRNLLRLTTSGGTTMAAIAVHDYDLAGSKGFDAVRRLLMRFTKRRRILPLAELAKEAAEAINAS